MKQKDHKALAYFLMDCAGRELLWRKPWHRRFFLLGCICPDYLPFTYLRGFRQSHAMLGHHARYSGAYIQKTLQRMQRHGVKSRRDCFVLGTLMHYLADSFTFPHTNGFTGTMGEHRKYEKGLHERFTTHLSRARRCGVESGCFSAHLTDRFRESRLKYETRGGGYELDCEQILRSCAEVFLQLCEV